MTTVFLSCTVLNIN